MDQAPRGGGIFNDGTLYLSGAAVSNNSSSSDGAGIFNSGNLFLTNSTLSNNSATSGGGGIDNYSGTLTITNCTLANNSAQVGGGIENFGTLTLINSTLSSNSAQDFGGGIDNQRTLTLANTIVAGNSLSSGGTTRVDVNGPAMSLGHNLIGNPVGSSGWVDSDLLDVDPHLASLGRNGGPTLTMALMVGSPALDAGSASIPGVTVPALDQRGAIRGSAGVSAGAAPTSAIRGQLIIPGHDDRRFDERGNSPHRGGLGQLQHQ